MNTKFYQDKVAVITGASSGIGKALAFELASRGAKVVLGARREDKLSEVANSIIKSGNEATYFVMDVTDETLCKKLIEKAIEQYGKLDILICNAGISMRASFVKVNMSVLHRLMDVNFWGSVNCVKHALPHLIESKGSIIGISSTAGIHGLPGRTGYSASKYALTGFLETIRIENLKNKIHVMIAIPGFTESNIRYSALTAEGDEQGFTPRDEKKMMSAGKAAKYIVDGIKRKKRYLFLDLEGKLVSFVKKIATPILDKAFYNAMAKEPNSPFKFDN